MEKKKNDLIITPSGELTKPIIKWNKERTDLIETGEVIDVLEEMKARAKGTTVYELINACGGVDNLIATIPPNKGTNADYSQFPEFSSQMRELAEQVKALTEEQNAQKVVDIPSVEDQIAKLKEQIDALTQNKETVNE